VSTVVVMLSNLNLDGGVVSNLPYFQEELPFTVRFHSPRVDRQDEHVQSFREIHAYNYAALPFTLLFQ